jgi:hypothetical protein
VLLWFVGGSLVLAWVIFHDPGIDYRVLLAGAILPDVVDVVFGGARVLHSLAFAVALLVLVVLATIGRRTARRRWIFLPIGVLFHLVLDGAFAVTAVFWWPFTGWGFDDEPLPSVDRGAWSLVLELAGLAALLWFWRRFGLADRARRQALFRTGHLDPALA